MIKEKIEILNEIIKTHPQFKNKSLLYDGIKKTLDCSTDKAKQLAATHCNMISFYAILTAGGTLFGSYSDYFRWMLKKDFCDEKGYISADKIKIINEIGKKSSLKKFKEIDISTLDAEKFYQVKIHGNTEGFHFMAGYIDDGVFKISDTSYRGIGVKASDHITEKNLVWIMEC